MFNYKENICCSATIVDLKHILIHNPKSMKGQFLPQFNVNFSQPQLNLNWISTKLQLNLLPTSASNQPQPQFQSKFNLNFNLNLIWMWHISNPILYLSIIDYHMFNLWKNHTMTQNSIQKVIISFMSETGIFLSNFYDQLC